ncbi:phosphotransferase [Acuticoccus sediminis]|uniref:Phosphotransferase n=1 Tax=Acuticoccus sediminis TaxID=2184697 RepID=A0A8B2NV20_9HYPH|nr:CehA/McbA family metallohydrolase [Acuticoccus sediminis]RAH99486.1 phosphotransferase [Acuticoccus sediminis]
MPSGLDAFTSEGRFFRGNVHTHSTRSDGVRDPSDVCAFYREAGYDFLCLSDHFLSRFGFPITDTRGERTNRFTTLLGAEVHAPANSHGDIWHVLAVGLPEDFAPTAPEETGVALAARCHAAGAFVGIAHPQWSSLTIEDGRAMAGHAHAVEIYNTSSALETGRGDGVSFWDALINEGYRHLSGYATDDAHFKVADHGHAWMMVKAPANEPEALLAAMKAGHYYASTGPVIHALSIEDGEAVVETSEVGHIAAVGRGCRGVTVSSPRHGGMVTRARLPLRAFAGDWVRIVAVGHDGRTAWTNPVYL